jgi:hypothetical protein
MIKILFSLNLHNLDIVFLLIIEFLHVGSCIVFYFLLLYIKMFMMSVQSVRDCYSIIDYTRYVCYIKM